jgi:glycosyltransferase involved in cell wall biosynthesis
MSKIPVAIILNTFCIGGAELLVSQFIEHEARDSHEFEYFIVELWPSEGVYSLDVGARFKKFAKILSLNIKEKPIESLIKLILFLRKNRIRLIHAHFTVSSIVSLIGKIFLPSTKLVITEHSMTNLSWSPSLKSFLYAVSLVFSAAIIAVSVESKKYILRQIPWKRKSVFLVTNAINLTPFLQISEMRKIQPIRKIGEIHLCLISRLVPEKNISDAIDICNLIFESGYSVELTIIGDGPSRYDLENYALRFAKFGIRFVGFSNDITSYLLQNDGLISMSVDESFSLVILEALASGIPCFGFENKARDTFSLCEPPLFLYPYGEIEKVATKISEILCGEKRLLDSTYTKCLQETFDIKNHAFLMRQVYKNCLKY